MSRPLSLPYKTRPAVLAALELGSGDWNKLASDGVVRDIISKLLDDVHQAGDDDKRHINITALRRHLMNLDGQEEEDHSLRFHTIVHAIKRLIRETDFAVFADRMMTTKAIDAALVMVKFFLYENSPSRQRLGSRSVDVKFELNTSNLFSKRDEIFRKVRHQTIRRTRQEPVDVTVESVDEEARRILQHLTGEAVDEMVGLQPELLTEMDNTDFQDKRYLEACTHLEVDPGTPTIDGLELILESYQVIGISWMRSMEEGPIGGGILGDFPGAGKSVQAVGLLIHSRNQWERDDRRDAPKPSLIVYPASMAAEWFLKIRKYAPTLRIYHYHGGSEPLTIDSRIFDGLDSSNESTVVLASYEFWSARHPGEPIREASGDEEFGAKDNRDPRGVLTGLFRRVICDEGHKLKGGSSRPRARSIISLASQYRHIHTATPMSNRVGDLVGLLEFLERPEFLTGVVGYLDPYTDPGMELARITAISFKRHVLRHLESPNGKTFKLGVQRLRKLLGMITLARTAHSTVPEAVGYVYSAGSNPSGLISEGIPRVEVKTIEVEFDAEEWALWSAHADPLWECLYQDVTTTTSGTKIKRMNMAVHRKLSVTSTNPLLLAAITNTEPDWRARGGGKEHCREDENTMEYWIEVDFALVTKWRAEGRDLDFFLKKMAGVDQPLETPLDRLAYIHNGQPKLSFLDRIVHETITRKYSKLIVFVHWPIIGWLLELYYKAIGFNVSVLHSGLSKGAREVMIYGFNHDTEPEILITSYGVGSCGVDLHLRCGSMVLYETAVNVQTEQRAIGRIHRRGQKDKQTVWRLVTVGSYQEFQQMMQLKKYTPIFECLRKEGGPLANKAQETLYKIMTGQEQRAGVPEYCKGWMEKYRERAFPRK